MAWLKRTRVVPLIFEQDIIGLRRIKGGCDWDLFIDRNYQNVREKVFCSISKNPTISKKVSSIYRLGSAWKTHSRQKRGEKSFSHLNKIEFKFKSSYQVLKSSSYYTIFSFDKVTIYCVWCTSGSSVGTTVAFVSSSTHFFIGSLVVGS